MQRPRARCSTRFQFSRALEPHAHTQSPSTRARTDEERSHSLERLRNRHRPPFLGKARRDCRLCGERLCHCHFWGREPGPRETRRCSTAGQWSPVGCGVGIQIVSDDPVDRDTKYSMFLNCCFR
jgi:hypothetical protein